MKKMLSFLFIVLINNVHAQTSNEYPTIKLNSDIDLLVGSHSTATTYKPTSEPPMYDIRLQDAGLNIAAGYKINTANKYQYNYGNKLNSTAQLYYKFRIKNKFTVVPNAGIMYEQSQKDLDDKITVYASGGNFLAATVGVETAFKKIAVGANWQTPLSQNLAHNFVKANNRAMLHVSFLL